MKDNRGGKRKGAGRKARLVPRKAITVRVDQEVAEKFKRLREANQRSESEQFSEMVNNAPDA